MKNIKILFIVWDGPQVNYLQGLFYPIFMELQKDMNIEFHVLQFTWGNPTKIAATESLSKEFGFYYESFEIIRKPHPLIGSFLMVWKGSKIIKNYIKKHHIDMVMPRSTMPAMMINAISDQLGNCQIIFDADGLPLEERIDFSGLSKNSLQYKILKSTETKLLKRAEVVLTRSAKAVSLHMEKIGKELSEKFFVVSNGRDSSVFIPDEDQRNGYRKQLDIAEDEKVFVYCGSLGKQYGVEEMMEVFSSYHQQQPKCKFLVLTGSPDYLTNKIPEAIRALVLVKSVTTQEVPYYLNVADIAFAIRKPTYSMQGIAPIKLGEYMLMGLPCIASKGIGDTEPILVKTPSCFLFDHERPDCIESAVNWALTVMPDPSKIRNFALQHFSLQKSANDYEVAINYLLNKTIQ